MIHTLKIKIVFQRTILPKKMVSYSGTKIVFKDYYKKKHFFKIVPWWTILKTIQKVITKNISLHFLYSKTKIVLQIAVFFTKKHIF